MILHIDSTTPKAYPLTTTQSGDLLRFCLSVGATAFTVNFPFVEGEDSEQLADALYRRLSRFSAGEKVLENLDGNSFGRSGCRVLNEDSIEAILKETGGNLFAYNLLRLPEQWLFYVGDAILLQVVSHEQEATLRLSQAQHSEFVKLGITHKQGQPQFSGLTDRPIRRALAP